MHISKVVNELFDNVDNALNALSSIILLRRH